MLSRSSFDIRRMISGRKSREVDDESFVGENFESAQNDQCETKNFLRSNTSLSIYRPRSRSSNKTNQQELSPWRPRSSSSQSLSSQKSSLWVPRSRITACSLDEARKSAESKGESCATGSILAPRPKIAHIAHSVSNPLTSLPDSTPHSSASSLCSCEYHSHAHPLAPAHMKKNSRLSLFPSDVQQASSLELKFRPTSPSCPFITTPNTEAQASTFNLLEALSLEPGQSLAPDSHLQNRKKSISPSRPPEILTDSRNDKILSENAQQLIRETDEAFDPVGSALAEAKLASDTFSDQFPSHRHRTPPPVPTKSTFPSQDEQYSLAQLHPSSPVSSATSHTILNPINSRRKAPIPSLFAPPPGLKKKKSKKKGLGRSSSKKAQPRKPMPKSTIAQFSSRSKSNSRWTLTDNVTELLTAAGSKLFNRIEVDEMLTPEQVQELKKIRQMRLEQAEARSTNNSEQNNFNARKSLEDSPPATDVNEGVVTKRSSQHSDNSTNTQLSSSASTAPVPLDHRNSTSSIASTSATSTSTDSIEKRDSTVTISSITSIKTISSSESGCETPVDSFHLSDLPSRINASKISINTHLPVSPFSFSFKGFGTEDDGAIVCEDFSISKNRQTPLTFNNGPLAESEQLKTPKYSPSNEVGMKYKAISFPSPPLKNPNRVQSSKSIAPLPTIPEIILSPCRKALANGRNEQDTMEAVEIRSFSVAPSKCTGNQEEHLTAQWLLHRHSYTENETFIYLHGTPFTLTHPGFLHGPIRFNKAELRRNQKLRAFSNRSSIQDREPLLDETLDWTSFQMALMGGAGEVFWANYREEDEEEYQVRREREELEDEVREWWSEMGKGDIIMGEMIGQLYTEDTEPEIEYFKWADYLYDGDEKAIFSPESATGTPELSSTSPSETGDEEKIPEMKENTNSPKSSFLSLPDTSRLLWVQRVSSTSGQPSSDLRTCSSKQQNGGSTSDSTIPLTSLPLLNEEHQDTTTPIKDDEHENLASRQTQREQEQLEHEIRATLLCSKRPRSSATLPSSSIIPIQVKANDHGKPEVSVPMGYNLGHDLGDFLKWESEHAYADGYYGPERNHASS